MFPKWQNPGRKSGIVLTFLQIVCLSKAMPPAFILLEDVVLNEVYKEIVAPVEMWGRGAFPSGECHRSGKSVFGALQGFSCSSLGILLKSLRIQWLFWENFKLVTVLDVWVALFGFQSGFIGFFLFNSRSSTGPVGRLWATARCRGAPVDFGPCWEKGTRTKLPSFVRLAAEPGDKGAMASLPDPQYFFNNK